MLYEALSIQRLNIQDKWDAMYVVAGFNLINSFVNRVKNNKALRKRENMQDELYLFKKNLSSCIAHIVEKNIDGVRIYIDSTSMVYISINNIQFSFHQVSIKNAPMFRTLGDSTDWTRTDILDRYSQSPRNQPQDWAGIRLQPIASVVLDYSRLCRQEEKKYC
jgi:hypothetical protein